MARGNSRASSEALPQSDGNDAYKSAYNSVSRGTRLKTLSKELDALELKQADLKASVEYQNATSDLARINREHTHIEENYYGSDGMWRERVWNKDTPQSIKSESDRALRIKQRYEGELEEIRNRVGSIRVEMGEIAKAKLRVKELLPDHPGVPRDKGGYQALKDLSASKEGKAQLYKIPQTELAYAKQRLARDAASAAQLEGEDSGEFKGKVEREVTFGKFKLKVVADVDYKNDPYGDSYTTVEDTKYFIKPA